MVDINNVNGNRPEIVQAQQPKTGVFDWAFKVVPKRGTWLRFLNYVTGDERGVPVYMKLRDTNGNLLPAGSTSIRFAAREAGMSQFLKISEEMNNISFWNSQSLKTQRDSDHVSSVKINLEWPENAPNSGVRDHVDVQDTGAFAFEVRSPAPVDPALTEWYIDSSYVEAH